MRIGIATSTSVAAELLRRTLAEQTEHDVCWVASSGQAATLRCADDLPDLVLMELPLAMADAGAVTRTIVRNGQCAVLVLADNVAARAALVFEAMGYGAIDAADMPGDTPPGAAAAPLVGKVETIARLRNGRPGHGRRENGVGSAAAPRLLVAIGASAGGPPAIATLLGSLPHDFPGVVVVVQHVGDEFVSGMAGWLSERSRHHVSIAGDGDRLRRGRILLAGGARHLTLTPTGRLAYSLEPRGSAYTPSVDVFFDSVSRNWAGDAVGVLLTGMGKDGALGLKALRERRHYTIAQDEATSAVYGMPKAAAALHAAVDILPLPAIADRLTEIGSAHLPRVR